MGAKQILAGVIGAGALVASLVGATPGGAAEVSDTSCPTSAEAWLPDGDAYPPFGTAAPDDASPLVGCTGPFVPTSGTVDLSAGFAFPGLPTDACVEVTALTLRITGIPEVAGYGVTAWSTADGTPIRLASGAADGGYQQYGAAAGTVINASGASFESPSDQPSTGEYTISIAFDPTVLTAAELAAGGLGATVITINAQPGFADQIAQLQVEATVDDAACAPTTSSTSTTSTSTTSTTTAPTTTAPTTPTSTAPQAVVAQPRFTG